MTAESYWTVRLRKFSLLDFALVKLVYLLFGLWVLRVYPGLGSLEWWFYLSVALAASIPILVHWLSLQGGPIRKARAYLAGNNPALQVLLLFSQFFFGVMLGVLFPVLVNGPWWLLLLLITLAAIKPMTRTVLW